MLKLLVISFGHRPQSSASFRENCAHSPMFLYIGVVNDPTPDIFLSKTGLIQTNVTYMWPGGGLMFVWFISREM